MKIETLPTFFAPPERLTLQEIKEQNEFILKMPFIGRILDIIPDYALILNEQRQILFANKAFRDFVGICEEMDPLGARVGEAVKCVHSDAMTGGCGTSEFCQECGAANAIVNSQKGKEDIQECQITRKSGDALDFKVWVAPFELNGQLYSFFFIADKSDEKRRRILERIFFHDIMNTIGGLYGFADLLSESLPEDDENGMFAKTIFDLSGNVIEEIQAQKDILAAENHELIISWTEIDSLVLLKEIAEAYRNHEVARGKIIAVSPDTPSIKFKSDRTLLRRVISNMTKNALEASKSGETVTLSCDNTDEKIVFKVHNPGYISRKIQLQIFNRSFSTKGKGRGLGTYSIKLLGERYLGGKVSFMTSQSEGTVFSISLPL